MTLLLGRMAFGAGFLLVATVVAASWGGTLLQPDTGGLGATAATLSEGFASVWAGVAGLFVALALIAAVVRLRPGATALGAAGLVYLLVLVPESFLEHPTESSFVLDLETLAGLTMFFAALVFPAVGTGLVVRRLARR